MLKQKLERDAYIIVTVEHKACTRPSIINGRNV